MKPSSPVFEETRDYYIQAVGDLDLPSLAERLGIQVEDQTVRIPLLDRTHHISKQGVFHPSGKPAGIDVCVVLCRYLLMAPDSEQTAPRWKAYRDFKDAGPLAVYWTNEVEQKLVARFAGSPKDLQKAGQALPGTAPAESYPYDYCRQFRLLPKIPVLMLFNHQEEEFPATGSVLFSEDADQYLDAESLAILGAMFARRLTTASGIAADHDGRLL